MNNKIKYILVAIIATGLFFVPSVLINAQGQNEILKMKAIQMCEVRDQNPPTDEYNINMYYCFQYSITVNGSPTYTYNERQDILIPLNLSKPKTINQTIIDAVKQRAWDAYGFNISGKKIYFHEFQQGWD